MKPEEQPDGSLRVYHPTKGYRRISAKRIRARAMMHRLLGINTAA